MMKNVKKHETDLIEELGTLAFASRLRRLSERLLRDGSLIYQGENLNFQARWFPVFYLLWRQSPLAVTTIAQRLHLTHPAVNQVAGAMTKAGLLISTRDSRDDRRRLLSLSPAGKSLARQLQPIWQDIRDATTKLVSNCGTDLLGAIGRIERSLDEISMSERIRARTKERQLAAVEIVGYQPRYRKEFEKLNLEWIEKYFAVESIDKIILCDPVGQIIENGGSVLFARLDRKIVGTVALIKHDSMTFELAKMAVSESARGQQVGRKLALAVLELAEQKGASRVVLHTNAKLTAALDLYRSIGFIEAPLGSELIKHYRRPTITMQLNLLSKRKSKGSRKQEEK
jgi:ribosomal protein S18 acetylase RimI-like enzyme